MIADTKAIRSTLPIAVLKQTSFHAAEFQKNWFPTNDWLTGPGTQSGSFNSH